MRIATLATASRWIALFAGFTFFVGAILLGGTASLAGDPVVGHYYLSSHGKQTEVSEVVFWYSRAHALVAIGLFILAAILTMRSKPSERELRIGRYVGPVLVVSGFLLAVWWNHG
jgi:hypothetical protein